MAIYLDISQNCETLSAFFVTIVLKIELHISRFVHIFSIKKPHIAPNFGFKMATKNIFTLAINTKNNLHLIQMGQVLKLILFL